VLLFTEDGYLADIEIYDMKGSEFGGLPEAESLKLSERTPLPDCRLPTTPPRTAGTCVYWVGRPTCSRTTASVSGG
jgi:hypothetical protein